MKTLYIFDVDDTLIDTKACIRAIDKDGNTVFRAGTKVFNAPDSTERLLQPGLTWDFTEFESLEQIMSEPKLPAFEALCRAVQDDEFVIILTARQKWVMLHAWLVANGIDFPIDHIFCYDRSSKLNVPEWKGYVTRCLCKILDIKKVILYEDDPENIKSIKKECEGITVEVGSIG